MKTNPTTEPTIFEMLPILLDRHGPRGEYATSDKAWQEPPVAEPA